MQCSEILKANVVKDLEDQWKETRDLHFKMKMAELQMQYEEKAPSTLKKPPPPIDLTDDETATANAADDTVVPPANDTPPADTPDPAA